MVIGVNAQSRKTWDFTSGLSDETIANLNEDTTNWSANGTDDDGNVNNWKNNKKPSGVVYANGVEIAELSGIQISGGNGSNDLHVATTKIRVTRNNMKITLPKLAAGQTVTLTAKSANATATDRGFSGDDNLKYIEGPDGGIILGEAGLQTLVWQVKDDIEDSVAVTITTIEGGLDITSILIDGGDAASVDVTKNVAYITNLETIDEDYINIFLSSATDVMTLTNLSSSDAITQDSLLTYDAVVISPYVKADDAMVSVLKSAVAYEPMVNFNSNMYPAWGLGTTVPTTTNELTVAADYADHELFEGLDVDGLALLYEGTNIEGVQLGDYFAEDNILATAGDAVAIHEHNASRNAYVFIPFTEETIAAADVDVLAVLSATAVTYVAATKKDITKTSKPTLSAEHGDNMTTVTMTATSSDAVIRYTTDGTDPSDESTIYTEPVVFTEAHTVKAIAQRDGYYDSDVDSLVVEIFAQAAAPTISVEQNSDNSVVTITSEIEGATIYFSFNGTEDAALAEAYSEPVVMSDEPAYIYAFVVADNYVQSKMASEYVSINSLTSETIRTDTIAHFDANSDDWYYDNSADGGTGSTSAYYLWGKTLTLDEGTEKTYTSEEATDWIIKSTSEALCGEFTLAPAEGVGNGATGRYAENAIDLIGGMPSKGCITFNGTVGGSVETTSTYTAPFDVVCYVGNGNSGSSVSTMEVQISSDGSTWTTVDTLNMAATQRYYKKTRVKVEESGDYYVRVAHVGGGTKAQLYDIYIFNNGTYSQSVTGISEVESTTAEVIKTEVYSLDGIQRQTLQKGINIVRRYYSDGTVKTVKTVKE